jgi:hypothetical protein
MPAMGPVQPVEGAWHSAQDILFEGDEIFSKNSALPSCSMGVNGDGLDAIAAAKISAKPVKQNKTAVSQILFLLIIHSFIKIDNRLTPIK